MPESQRDFKERLPMNVAFGFASLSLLGAFSAAPGAAASGPLNLPLIGR